jgi:flagellar biosynthesis/type III secretory pathway chaperone
MPKLNLESLRAKQAKVAKELEALREQEHAELERRAMIAGQVVLAEAEDDSSFADALQAMLDRRLKKKRDRALFDLEPKRKRGAETALVTSDA